ncbi:hypothetical protein FNV43_RR04677 [Rhamnella rubrinervis]|uniref:CBM20 domain-containing protein n=1 Tax=Rhamnella rubrinervis TaxID=2594499 RepID=A0A8K0HM89_9ROSA|nr:hypothetical protein FNV43_RR04677 [Rhamnella rubrinervis]
MEASARSFTSIHAQTNTLSSSTTLLGRSDICLRLLISNVHFHRTVSDLRHKGLQLVASFQTKVSTGLEAAGISIHPTKPAETVRTKFRLHKECKFGEHFLLVGNEGVIGMWNPSKAIPLNWSHGNIWTVELYMPIELPIQFKFILKQSSGDIVWQPGPDRIFRAWKTNKTIMVSEDWGNALLQKITEVQADNLDAELLVTHDRQPTVVENVNLLRDKIIMNAKRVARFSEPTIRSNDEFIVRQKTTYPTEGSLTSTRMGISIADYSDYKKEAAINKKKSTTLKSKVRVSKEDEDMGIHEEGYVLVPGLKQIVPSDVK